MYMCEINDMKNTFKHYYYTSGQLVIKVIIILWLIHRHRSFSAAFHSKVNMVIKACILLNSFSQYFDSS